VRWTTKASAVASIDEHDEAVAAGHLGDHHHRRDRHARGTGEDRRHADDGEGRRHEADAGNPAVGLVGDPRAEHAADVDVGAEDAARAARGDRERHRDDLQQREPD
jgi:hypothetical protein